MPKSILEKIGLAGIGIVALTKEKIEKTIESSVKRGEIAKGDGEKLIRLIGKKAEEEKRFLEGRIKELVRKSLKDSGMATKKEVERLKKEIENLKRKKR